MDLIGLSIKIKRNRRNFAPLPGRVLAMVFHKPSLRTRVSFEVGMIELGGSAMYISDQEIKMGSRESIEDVARVLSRYVDCIMIRTFDHSICERLASASMVPVINGLTDLLHPCQVMGDLLTAYEKQKDLTAMKVAFIGDANNVANSWINAALVLGFELVIAHPEGYPPNPDIMKSASSAAVKTVSDPKAAADGADVLYTDVWASMGQEKEADERRNAFRVFRIDDAVLSSAKPDAIVMHCLPAHRGEEITDEVMDGPHSAVLDQAENRLHMQKALLTWLVGMQ
jgi:ornithine carbamoyltransferase